MRQKHIDLIENAGGKILDVEIREGREEALAFIIEKDGVTYRCSTSSLDRNILPWKSKRKTPKRYSHKNKNYIYRMFNSSGDLLYVGKTSQLDYRMYAHFYKKREAWKDDVSRVDACLFENEADMHIYEMYLIARDKPAFNRHAICSSTPTIILSDLTFTNLTDWE